MRFGQTTLFNDFGDSASGLSSQQNEPEGHGDRTRNFKMPERNNLLAHRFYFYDMIKFYKSEKCLEELSREFFLSEDRTIDLIREMSDLINELRQRRPSTRELQGKFPWINWSI